MATSLFKLYIDKENAGLPVKHKAGSGTPLGLKGLGLTPKVKTFADNDSNFPKSAPRLALRDINSVTVQPPIKNKQVGLTPVQQLFKKPAVNDHDLKFQKKSDKQKKSKIIRAQDSKHKVINKNAEQLPEKEQMFIYNEYEEKKPKQDLDYVGFGARIWRWKPTCVFGSRHDSDGEDQVDDDLPDLPPPQESFGRSLTDSEGFDVELVDIDSLDIPIHNIDCGDIPILNIDRDLPIPFLDDSLDIEPNLGTLEIYDSSTPMK